MIVADIKEHGAVGDGTTDDTAAIESAWRAGRGNIHAPAGDYLYHGGGLPFVGNFISITGDGPVATTFRLRDGGRLVDQHLPATSMQLRGFRTVGGAGCLRFTYTGRVVAHILTVEDCAFEGYTTAAIEHNASDSPYWRVNRCVFDGANYTTSMGVALSGLTDGSRISDSEFLRNRVHVKLRNGGGNAHINNCDFIRFGRDQGERRVDLWVVPKEGNLPSGSGFTIEDCKFGPEHTTSQDIRVLYADEEPGATNGERFPDLVNINTTGGIENHSFRSCAVGAWERTRFVYSMVQNVFDCRYADINFGGPLPSHVLEFARTPGPSPRGPNTIGPVYANIRVGQILSPSNDPNTETTDPNGVLSTDPRAVPTHAVSDAVNVHTLTRTPARKFTTRDTTISAAADAHGGETGAEIATTRDGQSIYTTLALPETGRSAWVEFDAKAGTLSTLGFRVRSYAGVPVDHYERTVALGEGWSRYRFRWVPAASYQGTQLIFYPAGAGTLSIGRVWVYQARGPQQDAVVLTSPGGGRFRLTVGDDGALGATPA